MTLEQIEKMQPLSAAALRNLQGDDDLADDVEEMTPREFADWRDIEVIENPPRRAYTKGDRIMPTIRELRADLREKNETITELENENEDLRDRLSEILGIASDDDEGDDEETDEPA